MPANPYLSRFEPWLQAVLPRSCSGCRRVGRSWCSTCSAAVRSEHYGLVPAPPGAPGILAVAGEHRDLLRSAVLLYKARHQSAVYADLLQLAARSLALVRLVLPALVGHMSASHRKLALVPVPPSSPRAWRSPAGELAEGLAAGGSGVEALPVLRSRGRRHSQKSLDATRRARNVIGAFEVRTPVSGHGMLAVLIDDVVTTGATMGQARMVLERAGFTVPAAVALTRTPGPGP